ncbi:MAG: winged helix-turn-helix transcriptional regulator [Chloroflexi bacterium]|nr:winged helix-turn-helix transcriptional regulator [Chloroflexota bacterium]
MSTAAEPNEPFVKDDLVVDFAARRVSLADNPVRLTQLEYRLLVDLCKHAGRVRTHAELLRSAWGPAHPGRSGAVRTVIKQLRRKLGDNADQPSYIYSEPRVGYRMAQPEPLDATHC